jgi:drug/metabolite transporter (DMT)-like permease
MLYGMRLASGAIGATVMSMTPAITALAAILFLGEHPSWRKMGAVALAFAGAAVLQFGHGLQSGSGGSVILGAGLVFGAVCCESAYTLLGQRMSKQIDPVLVAALAAGLSIPLFAVGAAFQWSAFKPGSIDLKGWVALLWYGGGTLALGSWLWYRGIAKVDGTTAAAFMGLMPLSALLLSYLLLGEPFRWIHLAGFATVFAGVLLMSWEHARMASQMAK